MKKDSHFVGCKREYFNRGGRPSKFDDIVRHVIVYLAMHGGKILLNEESMKDLHAFIKKYVDISDKTLKKHLENIYNTPVEVMLLGKIPSKIYPFRITRDGKNTILHLIFEFPKKEVQTILSYQVITSIMIPMGIHLGSPHEILSFLILAVSCLGQIVNPLILISNWLCHRALSQKYRLNRDILVRARILSGGKNITLTRKFKSYTPLSEVKKNLLHKALPEILNLGLLHDEDFMVITSGSCKYSEDAPLYVFGQTLLELEIKDRELMIYDNMRRLREMVQRAWIENDFSGDLIREFELIEQSYDYEDMRVKIEVREAGINLKKASESLVTPYPLIYEASLRIVGHEVDMRLLNVKEEGEDQLYLNKVGVKVEIIEKVKPLSAQLKKRLCNKIEKHILKILKKSNNRYLPEEVRKTVEMIIKNKNNFKP